MNEPKLAWAVTFFKALADENRLKIISLLNKPDVKENKHGEREYTLNVGELAKLLDLSEPTVSHHLSKLRPTGIINFRTKGNQRLYALNKGVLKRFGEQLTSLEAVDFGVDNSRPDKSWIDELDLSKQDKKVLRAYTYNGRLKQIPMKESKLVSIMRWLALLFEPNRIYTEKEVNELIKPINEDYSGLRRDLIGFGFLRRERNGSKYWLTPEDEDIAFDDK